jgi:succinyl-diaminopimelate desuccinylase
MRRSLLTPLELTQQLLRFDTINPPGNERPCAEYLGHILEEAGFDVDFYEFAEKRTSLIARIGGSAAKPPLCLTGHLDTVPLGITAWKRDPFGSEIEGDKLFGRGASDMKSGVAAIIAAATSLAKRLPSTPGVLLVLTAAEEGGCLGSKYLLDNVPDALGKAGAIVVGEPTAIYPLVGHKGAIKFWLRAKGVAAHGAMPELGVNAVYKAARAVLRLESFEFNVPEHPVMGKPTLNVGTFHGGVGINFVPDEAKVGVDIRTIPGVDHKKLIARLTSLLGEDIEIIPLQDEDAVWTDPADEWVQTVFGVAERFLGSRPIPKTVPYFSDAGSLRKAYRSPPTVLLGPGEPAAMHQTDEYCHISRVEQAVEIYQEIIQRWCNL